MIYFDADQTMSPYVDYSRVITPFLACWSCFYFFQLLPLIGFFITSIYSMMKNLVILVVIYVLMILPFISSFYNLVNGNSVGGCIPGFQNIGKTIYSLFEIMLNMINLTTFQVYNSSLLYLTHIMYTFLVSIMLINFFVAVMIDSVSAVSQAYPVTECLQKVSMAFSVENHWRKLLWRYYNMATKKCFVCENGRVLLTQVTSAMKKKN